MTKRCSQRIANNPRPDCAGITQANKCSGHEDERERQRRLCTSRTRRLLWGTWLSRRVWRLRVSFTLILCPFQASHTHCQILKYFSARCAGTSVVDPKWKVQCISLCPEDLGSTTRSSIAPSCRSGPIPLTTYAQRAAWLVTHTPRKAFFPRSTCIAFAIHTARRLNGPNICGLQSELGESFGFSVDGSESMAEMHAGCCIMFLRCCLTRGRMLTFQPVSISV